MGQVGSVIGDVIVPFVTTPTNVGLASLVDYTPIGFLKAVAKQVAKPTRGQLGFVNDIGRATTGTGIMTIGVYLASQGLLTGSSPDNKAERAMNEAEGKKANSVSYGGNWYQLNRISPIGNLLALGADFYQMSKEKETTAAAIVATTGKGAKNLTEMSFLKGVSGALKVVNDPERGGERWVEQITASSIPSIIGRIANTMDTTARAPTGIKESIQARIPKWKETLPKRRDIFGNEVTVPGGVWNLIDPMSSVESKDNPVIAEARAIKTTISMPGQTMRNVKLTAEEYDKFQKISGRTVETNLKALIDSDEYKTSLAGDKVKLFEEMERAFKEAVKDIVFPALMIRRYGLPADTDYELFNAVFGELTKHDKFNEADKDKQKEWVIKNIESNK